MTASDHLKHRTGSLSGDQIPEDLKSLHKAASAYAIATRKTDVDNEAISPDTLNEIEWAFIEECALHSNADHRNSDFRPFVVQELIERIAKAEATIAQKTRECEELRRDRNEWKDAAQTRGAEASGLMRDCDNLKAQVEQLGRQVAEMALRLNYCQFDHTTPECFRGRGRGASAYRAAFESAWKGREFDGELYTREPHRSAWRKGYIDGQQAFALASRAHTK